MTKSEFTEQMQRLMGLRFVPAGFDTHWEALSDMPVDALREGVTRSQRTREDFPTPVELRRDADLMRVHPVAAAEDRAVELDTPVEYVVPQSGQTVRVTREWRYHCERCGDVGWAEWWCGEDEARRAAWMEFARCERHGAHGSHPWTKPCECSDGNPALIRKREAVRKYAEAPGKLARAG